MAAALTSMAMSFWTLESFRLAKEIAFHGAAISLAATGALKIIFKPRRHDHWWRRPEIRLALAAIVWAIAATVFAVNRAVAAASLPWLISTVIIVFATVCLARSRGTIWLTAIVFPAILNVLILFPQVMGVWNPFSFPPGVKGRRTYTALVGNPDDVGVYLVVPVLAAIAMAATSRRYRVVFAIAATILFTGLIATQTLTAIIACMSAMLVLFVLVNSRMAVAGTLLTFLLVLAVLSLNQPLRKRVSVGIKAASSGNVNLLLSGRPVAFAAAYEMFKDHPITGVGPGCFKFSYFQYRFKVEEKYPSIAASLPIYQRMNFGEVHNDHLQLLSETGVPGYALFVAACVMLARCSSRKGTRADASQGESRMLRSETARLLALPTAVALVVSALGQFPLHLAAPLFTYLFVGGTCLAWSRP
jgi:O-antigen ligase